MLTKSAAIILGIIQESPINAYEIIKMIDRLKLKDWFNVADSTVYATLKALEKKSYIKGQTQKDGNMPDKTIYAITESGLSTLKKTIETFICHFDYDLVPFMIACFFIKVLDPKNAVSYLEDRLAFLEKCKDGIREQLDIIKHDQSIPEYVTSNVEHNALIIEAEITATKMVIKNLDI